MNRPIKFRMWDLKEEEMNYQIVNGIYFEGTLEGTGTLKMEVNRFFEKLQRKFIIMQFTGLCDKNGKEIYEGDIVEFKLLRTATADSDISVDSNPFFGRIGPIIFKDGMFLIDGIATMRTAAGDYSYAVEVIGNVYENPQLLEKEQTC